MHLKDIIDIAQFVFMVFLAMGGGVFLHRKLPVWAASERNEHIKTALVVADQLVVAAEKYVGSGEQQSNVAATGMKARLDEMGIGKYFTQQQIEKYIEYSYNKQVSEGVIGNKVEQPTDETAK